jgi:DNA-binding MarR family transcriptional regulator
VQNTAIGLFEPENNIIFHKDLRFHPELTFGEKMFLAEIQSITSKRETKRLNYSLRDLSELFGVSHQTIKNWIRKLVKLELLEIGIDFEDTSRRQYLKTKNKI